jgi:Conjugative transposon protein TcpC
MLHRPYSDNGTRSSGYYPGTALLGPVGPDAGVLDADTGLRSPGSPLGRPWRGTGGRWLLWPLRAVLWVTPLVIAVRGLTAIVFGQAAAAPASGAASARTPARQFPVTLAEAYATASGQAYPNFSPATQAQCEQQLAAFGPAAVASADPDLGWNGAGQLTLQSEQVAGIVVPDPQHAVVTLLATVNGQLMELGVPVVAPHGGITVSGEPAWLPATQQISPPLPASHSSDPVAQSWLMNVLPRFFQAYGSGDSAVLNGFLAPGVKLTGLGGAVTFDSIAGLYVPPGGTTRQITVTVIWQVPGLGESSVTKLEMAYGMSVVDLHSGKWYVNEISASTEAVGAK